MSIDESYRKSKVVQVLERGDKIHSYKMVGVSRVPGDDHIASDREFDLEYVNTQSKGDQPGGGSSE